MNIMEDDLAGRLIAAEPEKWDIVNIPCEAEENDILGRKVGDALFPEIGKGNDWLTEFKKSYMTAEGVTTWNALFQGRPTSIEGNIIHRNWFKFYDELPSIAYKCISVDATFKDNKTNDFVAIQVWGKKGPNYYLIDRMKERMDFPKTLSAISNLQNIYRANVIFIEDKANGSAIISMLKKRFSGVIAINPEGGKIARVNAIAGIIESGNVFLPETRNIQEFIQECISFPNAKHDDEVDAMSQALNRLKNITADTVELTEAEKLSARKYNNVLNILGINGPDETFFNY